MRKLLLLLFVVFAVFVVWNRQRLFLRDPLATVTRAGVKEDGAQVFINFSNDVMIENDNAPIYVQVVEHGNHSGAPQHLQCIHYVACLLDADVPTLEPWPGGITVANMSSKFVSFHERRGDTLVELY